ncbi:MAG: hypothetical protein LBC61_00050 [Candidatus Peribacteria bacterium]|jgi:hypothetical protein|nr:hypothetical protein [Candidatus Peribacteria bacterium]
MIDDKAYHVSDYPQFKVSLNMLNLTFDENNPIMDNDKVYGGISYQLKIQDLLNGVSSVFSKVQDTLLKEVTDEMIQNQINRIIDGCKVFLLNINKQINLKNMYYAKLYFCRIFGYTLIALEIIELALIVAYTTTFQFHVVAYVIIELVLIGVSIFMNALDIEESEETIKFLENSILAYEKTTQKYVFKYEQIIDVLEKTKNSNPSNDKKYTELMNFYIKNSNLYMANEFYTLSVDLEYVKSLGIGAGVYLVGA